MILSFVTPERCEDTEIPRGQATKVNIPSKWKNRNSNYELFFTKVQVPSIFYVKEKANNPNDTCKKRNLTEFDFEYIFLTKIMHQNKTKMSILSTTQNSTFLVCICLAASPILR